MGQRVVIPHNRELEFEYGVPDTLSPLIRRVVANNPGPFTFHGTGTYIVGRGEVAVIDPGPLDQDHVDAILKTTEGEKITHIIITHTHRDHSPNTQLLQPATGATTYGYGQHGKDRGLEIGTGTGDYDFIPDIHLKDGDVVEGNGWTLEAVHTPGHASNHLCFALKEENILFSGDQVMGWSTTVVSDPDGHMGSYIASCEKLLKRGEERYWPNHGTCIEDPQNYVTQLIAHRRDREEQITHWLGEGLETIATLVDEMYKGLDPRLYRGACRAVHAHLIHMVETDRALCDGKPTEESIYRPAS
ncbi:MAG TPA: MBL fold metallo-hydrolase [Rhodospirillaceae bacterium]|nr:MBL fold metallo-hydrolase [Rhodospirillaceae bacterium]HAA92302.1 MBL fold metallo-hydrolase [Rhodospirillaceae bacterium]HAT36312.1 MBL fold metallo-hydrolase [Rhodospirillaceae bacterium]